MNQLTIVGIGPGGGDDLTLRAKKALEKCDVIIGYTVYVELLRPAFPQKEFRTTPMRKEVERCRMALSLAQE
jgi:precorrin-3B C17-methyltransferase